MLAVGGLRREVLVNYRILCCYSTNYLYPLVSPSQTWPNFDPTPSTGYQTVSAPTAGGRIQRGENNAQC